MERSILIGIVCYTVLRSIELYGRFFFVNKKQEIIVKPDPRIQNLIDTYKQEQEYLDDDRLEDSHTAMGAAMAYARVIKDLEELQ